jgi:hypothetical protein
MAVRGDTIDSKNEDGNDEYETKDEALDLETLVSRHSVEGCTERTFKSWKVDNRTTTSGSPPADFC